MKIGFIGVGKMAGAILTGLLSSGALKPEDVILCGRNEERSREQARQYGVSAAADHCDLVSSSDLFFIGVEPREFPEVLETIRNAYDPDKVCVSMAAGVNISDIEHFLGTEARIIRIMPNTPASVGEVMTSVSANANVSEDEIDYLLSLFRSMGRAEVTPEDQIPAVSTVSGSSPAYTYMFIRALAAAGERYGMDPQQARIYAAQAVLGAAKIVLTSDIDLDTLINNVCTPGGTTIEAVTYMREHGMEELITDGASQAVEKFLRMSGKK